FVSDRKKMGEFVIPLWQKISSWIAALLIISLNIKLVYNEISVLMESSDSPLIVSFTIMPVCLFSFLMLMYILFVPLITRDKKMRNAGIHEKFSPLEIGRSGGFNRIAVTVDFGTSDNKAINKAIQLGNADSTLVLIHVLESTNAVVYGEQAFDQEREDDYKKLKLYQEQLEKEKINCEIQLGFGVPKNVIPELVVKNNCDSVVMGKHGHRRFKDMLLGTTIESVRHNIKVPLVLV